MRKAWDLEHMRNLAQSNGFYLTFQRRALWFCHRNGVQAGDGPVCMQTDHLVGCMALASRSWGHVTKHDG
jgi:hypothetical protein